MEKNIASPALPFTELRAALARLVPVWANALLAERGLSVRTVEAYRQDMELFLLYLDEWDMGRGAASSHAFQLGEQDIMLFLAWLRARQNTGRSLARRLSALRSLFAFAVEEKVLPANPAALLESPRLPQYLPEVLSREEMERLQLLALRAASMLDATEKVVFIDSMVVDKQQFVDHYRIGRDAGRVGTYRTLFPKGELQLGRCGQSAFVNELGDMAYVAVPDTSGDLKLSRAERAGGQWSRTRALAGLAERTGNQDFPFVMADGITLYYAEESDEGLGGYDIYVTRYNSDDERFVKPENIGMPFNSPANDYLYAIDEFNNLGWFATDRNQPAGKVCIYTFIPNPSRETYVLTEYNADEVRAAARIASVARTQAGSRKLAEAKAVLAQLRAEPAEAAQGSSFSFITADGRLFTSVRQLPDAQSRKLGEQWSAATTQLSQQREQLDQMRRSYAAAYAE